MADIGEISTKLQQLYDTDAADSLQQEISTAATHALQIHHRTMELLDGSENPEATALLGEIEAITNSLGELATRITYAQQLQENLVGRWTGNGGTVAPASGSAASPTRQAAAVVQPDPSKESISTPYPNVLKPETNYRNPVIQAQLDQPLTEVFSPSAIGDDASKAILPFFHKHSQVTLRDLMTSGSSILGYSSFAQRYRVALGQRIREFCPEIPLAKHLSTNDIARISPELSQVPIQAVFSGYVNATRRRVSIADLVDPETGKVNGYARTILRLNRPENARLIEKIETFVRDHKLAAEAHQWE